MGTGAGAIGDVDRVGDVLERRRFAQKVLRIAGHRRGELRRHDESAGPQPLLEAELERAGEGTAVLVHERLNVAGV